MKSFLQSFMVVATLALVLSACNSKKGPHRSDESIKQSENQMYTKSDHERGDDPNDIRGIDCNV